GSNRARDPELDRIFRIFGRPERKAVCDCERSSEPAVPQMLFLMTDERLLRKVRGGRLEALLTSTKSDADVAEELFLATLSRPPTPDELASALGHVKAKRDRRAAFADVVWALINTREFLLNH